jgi:GT2 family glycosyltransferase/glycosyltransferase involved in cell wall biosynthesis
VVEGRVVRLLLALHAYPPEGGGGSEIYTEALARRLARDHDVTVLHASADPGRPDHDVRSAVRDGVRVVSLNNRHLEVPGFESYRDPRAAAAAARLMDEARPELMHVGHLTGLSTGVVFEARRRGIPVVITLHDFWTLCPLGQLLDVRLAVCPGPTPRRCLGCVGGQVATASPALREAGRGVPFAGAMGRLLSRLGSAGERRVEDRLREMREVLHAADVLVSPSRFLSERMSALGVSGIVVLANGHEPVPQTAPVSDPGGRVRFGFVGSAIPSKGVHVLAEAFRLLDDPRAGLAIHGPFVPYHGDHGYEARVRQVLGPAADAVLRGPFAHRGLGGILAGLDVLVVPSIWEENAPLTVQEAFLARRPVVVSDHGGLAEMVREGVDGLRFRPGDPKDLARVMRRLLDEPGLREGLAREPPAVPTMDEHVAALGGLYAEAARRARSRPGRVGVVVLDRGRPEDATAAARSALDPVLAPQVLVVENGPGPDPILPEGVTLLRLPENRGYAGGMNAGVAVLRERGCDRVLLLNNDATLEEGALRRLAEAVDDPGTAAAGPVVLRAGDGRVESRGADFDPRRGRFRLLGHGEPPSPGEGRIAVGVLSGVALMVRLSAWDRIGPLDESYFHSFEDVDWSLRAREAGFTLVAVLGARVRHAGARTLGAASSDRLYYAARNHLRAAERRLALRGFARRSRLVLVVGRNLAHALVQGDVPRGAALVAVREGVRDFRRGVSGPRKGRP